MRKFFREFKAFISRGNIVDLSVAVIIGAAFSAIVTALTEKIIRPLINWVLWACGGKDSLASAYTFLHKVLDADGNVDLASSIYIDWGAFIAAIINFLLIALVLFIIVKTINASRQRVNELRNTIKKEAKKERIQEKLAVKAQAKKEGKKFKVAWKEHLEAKRAAEEEKAKLEAEEKARKEEEERLNNPTEQELLKEIRDILKAKKK